MYIYTHVYIHNICMYIMYTYMILFNIKRYSNVVLFVLYIYYIVAFLQCSRRHQDWYPGDCDMCKISRELSSPWPVAWSALLSEPPSGSSLWQLYLFWLVVYLPPWNISKSVGMINYSQYIGKIKNVSNHQPIFLVCSLRPIAIYGRTLCVLSLCVLRLSSAGAARRRAPTNTAGRKKW